MSDKMDHVEPHRPIAGRACGTSLVRSLTPVATEAPDVVCRVPWQFQHLSLKRACGLLDDLLGTQISPATIRKVTGEAAKVIPRHSGPIQREVGILQGACGPLIAVDE